MKKILVLLPFMTLTLMNGQECKVLMKSISGSYQGDCKRGKADGEGTAKGEDTYSGEFRKGLPHGKGIYTWKDGKVYEGGFDKGEKEGEGKLTIAPDSVVTGFWKKDAYVGLFENPYRKIDKSANVSSYTINKVQDDINNLRFYVRVNQEQQDYPGFSFVVHSGRYQTQINNNDFVELTNVTFPIKLKANYGRDFIEIEIFQPGLWEIRTDITHIKGLN